jgi:hypothetical protein
MVPSRVAAAAAAPLADVSNAVKTPYKAERFSGFVLPDMTAPAQKSTRKGPGAKAGPARARAGVSVSAVTPPARKTAAKRKPVAKKGGSPAAVTAPATTPTTTPTDVCTPTNDDAATPGQHYGDATTPAPFIMMQTPMAGARPYVSSACTRLPGLPRLTSPLSHPITTDRFLFVVNSYKRGRK